MKRSLLVTAACACFVLATLLVLVAVDASRWYAALRSDDVRYRAAADTGGLWDPLALVPFGTTRHLLGIEDDLAFRRAARAMRLANLETPTNSDTTEVLQRADAQARLEAIVDAGGAARRSRAMTLLAVLRLSTPSADPQERESVLRVAVAELQEAIELDPSNDDAKYNLETALRTSRGVQTVRGGPSPNPSAGASSSRGAATGPPGSGY